MKYIVIIFPGKWSSIDCTRYKINEMLSAGYKVKIVGDSFEEGLEYFSLKRKFLLAFIKASKKNKDSIQIFNANPNIPEINILVMCTIFNIQYSILIHNQILETFNNNFKKYLKIIYYKLIFLFLNNPKYIFFGGNSVKDSYLFNFAEERVEIHSHDYEIYLEDALNISQVRSEAQNKYAVFIDEGGDFHPDQDFVKSYSGFIKGYYPDLNKALKTLSSKLNVEIIIALHPRVDYLNAKNIFDFKISQDSTIDLIKNSDLVIGHKSTALSFAILYDKDILILESSYGEASYNNSLESLALFFNTLPLRMENIKHLKKDDIYEYFCKKDFYAKYINLFITPSAANSRSWVENFKEHLI